MEQGDFSSAIKQLIEKRFSGKSESLLKMHYFYNILRLRRSLLIVVQKQGAALEIYMLYMSLLKITLQKASLIKMNIVHIKEQYSLIYFLVSGSFLLEKNFRIML